MVLLSETDVVITLSEFDLLADMLGVIGVKQSDVYVLPELTFTLRSRDIQQKYSRSAIQQSPGVGCHLLKDLCQAEWTRHLP
jgi:hypothetical protein